MKKYLVISYGDFTVNSKVSYLLDSVSEITKSDFLTYKLFENSIIINFGTDVNFSKLENYFNLVFEKISDFYILVEQTNNTLICLPDTEEDSFTSLDGKNSDNDIDKKSLEIMTENILLEGLELLYEDINNMEDDEEDEDDILLKKSVKKEFSLDEILDKINETGISSLTKEENEYLKKLSK